VRIGRLLIGALYITAGAAHFLLRGAYQRAVPDYLPAHRELVLFSGAAEIAGGLGVLLPATQRPAAWGLVALLIAVFPANIWMAQHPERFPALPLSLLWARLPLQAVLIGWAWRYTRPAGASKLQ
jgi:uncharacterized membrane protein